MSKRTLLMVISLVASLALITTGTLAYLSDSDKDVNVMTLGNVDIVQNEQERTDSGELDAFNDNKPLLPAVFPGSYIPYAAESDWPVPNDPAWRVVEDNVNVVDKFVTVTNTGKTDAYVRTIVAVEAGCIGADTLIHTVQNDSKTTIAEVAAEFADYQEIEQVTIDGVVYDVLVFTYKDALKPGETTIPSLKQIYMNKAADNDFVATLGDTFDVLVLSQAVQAQGFTDAVTALNEAFGPVNKDSVADMFADAEIETDGEANNPPKLVTDAATLDDALAEGGNVLVSSDITSSTTVPAGETSLNLNQNTLNGNLMLADGAELTVANGTVSNTDDTKSAIAAPAGTSVVLNNVTVESSRHALRAEGGKMEINGGTYKVVPTGKKTLHALNVSDGSEVIVNDGTFIGPKGTVADSGAAVNVQAGSTVIINGGNFSGGKNRTLSCNAAGTLIIRGGTFDQDPTTYVDAGYKVTLTGGSYVVTAE